MEWASGGTLYSCIKARSMRKLLFKQTGISAIRFVLACIILALETLHQKEITYSDLKP